MDVNATTIPQFENHIASNSKITAGKPRMEQFVYQSRFTPIPVPSKGLIDFNVGMNVDVIR